MATTLRYKYALLSTTFETTLSRLRAASAHGDIPEADLWNILLDFNTCLIEIKEILAAVFAKDSKAEFDVYIAMLLDAASRPVRPPEHLVNRILSNGTYSDVTGVAGMLLGLAEIPASTRSLLRDMRDRKDNKDGRIALLISNLLYYRPAIPLDVRTEGRHIADCAFYPPFQ